MYYKQQLAYCVCTRLGHKITLFMSYFEKFTKNQLIGPYARNMAEIKGGNRSF